METLILILERPGHCGTKFTLERVLLTAELQGSVKPIGAQLEDTLADMRAEIDAAEQAARQRRLPLP